MSAHTAGPSADRVAAPTGLTVFFDAACDLCQRCRVWLEAEPTWVPIRFAAADAAFARQHLGDLPWLGTELVVVADDGSAWIGPAAFLTCLWATVRYRPWGQRLAGPAFAPLAERFLIAVSANRSRLAAALGPTTCDDGTCRHRIEAPTTDGYGTSSPSGLPASITWSPPPSGAQ